MAEQNQEEQCRRADEEVRKKLPPGVKLVRTLRGHTAWIGRIAWSPDGRMLASPSQDGTIRLWNVKTGECLRTLEGHESVVFGVAFDSVGHTLASGSHDRTVKLWEPTTGKLLRTLEGRQDGVVSVSFDPAGRTLASASADRTIKLWETANGKLLRTLEGHTGVIHAVTFSPEGGSLASKGGFADGWIRLWRSDTGTCVATIREPPADAWPPGLAFIPLPLFATVGSDPDAPKEDRDHIIHIYELDVAVLLGQVAEPSAHHINAKVVLVGDTGVGKSGLSLVLNNQPFEATDPTPGRRVWTFDSREVQIKANVTQTRETLLWDWAGQPGYRVIHQLHLNEVAVALVVFDARSETDPLAGVWHWERALRLAQQRQGSSGVPMKKFLVSARNDRGGVSIGEDRLQAILKEFGFDGYFKTSAKEGWEIKELRAAIEQAIAWEDLPEVSSSQLFADIKSFLLAVKKTGRLLAPAGQLYDEFVRQYRKGGAGDPPAPLGDSPSGTGAMPQGEKDARLFSTSPSIPSGGSPDGTGGSPVLPNEDLRPQFETCIGRLENRDLIRRLTFGGYVLLQPELLDAYASAMVNTAKEEPDGLGSLAEEIALAGKFFVPKEQKITDPGQEQLLLHATVEELVRRHASLDCR